MVIGAPGRTFRSLFQNANGMRPYTIPSMSTHPHLTFRDEVRGALIAIAVGICISTLAFGEKGTLGRILVNGGSVGLSIYISVSALMHLLAEAIDRLPQTLRLLARAAVYIVGGLGGWTLGIAAILLFYKQPLQFSSAFGVDMIRPLIVSCAAAVAVGLVFRSFEVMHARLREQEWAQKELELARSIQSRLLPPPVVEGGSYTIAARNLPARFVAGDFYDVVKLADGSVVIVTADVAGKGIGASLIMASVKAVVPFVAHHTVAEAMQLLNEKLVQELEKRQFVALAFARYFPSERTLHFANAGLPDPHLVRNGTAEAMPVGGERLPLGIRRDAVYETRVIRLDPSDRVVFLSDGIPEAPVSGDELLGYENLRALIGQARGASAEAWLDSFLAGVRARVGETLDDDWTAVVLEAR